jgi:glycerophosphoryl diester phosphodiesterase
VFVPANLGWLAWGWPNLFLERLRDAGSDVVIIAPLRRGEPVGSGLDDAAAFELVPIDWRGGVATDHVEVIGPLVAERRQ